MRLLFDLASDRGAPAAARTAIAPLAGGMSSTAFGDLSLILTELVTNSVVHGPVSGITVEVSIGTDGLARGVVRDDGTGVVAIREAVAGDDGGFGLRLVDRLTERWGVHEGSTHVWFELATA